MKRYIKSDININQDITTMSKSKLKQFLEELDEGSFIVFPHGIRYVNGPNHKYVRRYERYTKMTDIYHNIIWFKGVRNGENRNFEYYGDELSTDKLADTLYYYYHSYFKPREEHCTRDGTYYNTREEREETDGYITVYFNNQSYTSYV